MTAANFPLKTFVPLFGVLAAVALFAACTTTTAATRLGTKAVGSGGDEATSGNGNGTTTSASGGAGGASTSNGGGGGGTSVPSECLSNMNCAGDLDCMMGYHCNLSLTPPACEKLYCGPEGTPCSEDAVCVTGLRCFQGATCAPMSACAMPGGSCAGDQDCCGAQVASCINDVCCLTCAALMGGAGTTDQLPDVCYGSEQYIEEIDGCGTNFCAQDCAVVQLDGENHLALPWSAACRACLVQFCGSESITACMIN